MTRITITILTIVLMAVSSCCTKKKCGNNGAELKFNGFALHEVDTIYQILNGDTTLEQPQIFDDSTSSYNVRFYNGMQTGAVTVWIPGAGKVYEFSNFRYAKENCNQCFPMGYDKYDAYKGCTMNGVSYNNSPIDVNR